MKKNLLSIFIIIFILGFSISLIFLPKKEFSENENRYLEEFPKFSFESLLDGEYINSLETYLTDHFPLRDTLVGIKTSYQLLIGQKLINEIYVGKDEYLFQKYYQLFYPKLINRLNEFYEKNDVNMSIMLVPSSGVINDDKLPSGISYDHQIESMEYVYDNLKLNSINVIDSLKEGKKYYDMYYRLDHHWTTYGAYYAYLEYCKVNNLEPISIDKFDIQTVTNDFNGSLYSMSNIYSYKPDKIDVFNFDSDLTINYVANDRITNSLYEEKWLSKKDKYVYFLDGNRPLIQITNDEQEGQILIVKDSYANCFIPFLTNHYNKIHVIDLRYYNNSLTEYIKENNIDNVLFLYSFSSVDNDLFVSNLK